MPLLEYLKCFLFKFFEWPSKMFLNFFPYINSMDNEQMPIEKSLDTSHTNALPTLNDPKNFIATPELVFEWKKHYLKEGHSMASAMTYFNYIKLFVDYGIEINQKTVDRFREKHSSGVASAALKNFFNFLARKREFPQEILHIYFDKSKSKRKLPESLEPMEVDKIIDAMGRISIMDKYFTIVLVNLGLRISEGLKLKWEDFSWITWIQDKTKQGSVNLKNTKGGKFRVIPVAPEIMDMLYKVSNKNSEGIPFGTLIFDFGIKDYVFRKELSDENNLYDYLRYASDSYRDKLNRCSKESLGGKKIHPHIFRHFRATYLMNKGLSIEYLKAYLGHSSISSTEIYAQANPEILKQKIEEIDSK